MTELNKKALEAARKIARVAAQGGSTMLASRGIVGMVIRTYLDGADLVPRVQMDNAVSKARMVAISQRDEALREAEDWKRRQADARAEAEELGGQLAALREAARKVCEETDDIPWWIGELKTVLSDTAKAAAQWVRVPEGWKPMPPHLTYDMDLRGCEADQADYSGAGPGHQSESIADIYRAIFAAAPNSEAQKSYDPTAVIGGPEAGERTEDDERSPSRPFAPEDEIDA